MRQRPNKVVTLPPSIITSLVLLSFLSVCVWLWFDLGFDSYMSVEGSDVARYNTVSSKYSSYLENSYSLLPNYGDYHEPDEI